MRFDEIKFRDIEEALSSCRPRTGKLENKIDQLPLPKDVAYRAFELLNDLESKYYELRNLLLPSEYNKSLCYLDHVRWNINQKNISTSCNNVSTHDK